MVTENELLKSEKVVAGKESNEMTVVKSLAIKKKADDEIVAIENGKETILVVHKDEMVFIMSVNVTYKGKRFVKYVSFCEDSSAAHERMLHLMGKMLLKDQNSKYFNNPQLYDHMSNGMDGEVMSPEQFEKLEQEMKSAEDYFNSYRDKLDETTFTYRPVENPED